MLLDTPVRLGVQLQPQHVTYPQLRDAVRRVEDLGVDILFNWDHFFPLSGDPTGKHARSRSWSVAAVNGRPFVTPPSTRTSGMGSVGPTP